MRCSRWPCIGRRGLSLLEDDRRRSSFELWLDRTFLPKLAHRRPNKRTTSELYAFLICAPLIPVIDFENCARQVAFFLVIFHPLLQSTATTCPFFVLYCESMYCERNSAVPGQGPDKDCCVSCLPVSSSGCSLKCHQGIRLLGNMPCCRRRHALLHEMTQPHKTAICSTPTAIC
jgi:hypothetical protein